MPVRLKSRRLWGPVLTLAVLACLVSAESADPQAQVVFPVLSQAQ
ncbi:MAG: hypothetical protein Kow0013_18050 [Pararhodobacter sp.]